jgi:DNA-binding MarR family transcriptional regulator
VNKNVEMEPVKIEKAVESVYASSLYFASGAFTRQVEKLAKEIWKPSGLPPAQAHLLLHVIDNYNAFPYFIAGQLQLSVSAITRLAEKLEKKGLVLRITESRWTYIMATPEAWPLKPTLEECEKAFIDRCNALLGENEALKLAGRMNEATDKLAAKSN